MSEDQVGAVLPDPRRPAARLGILGGTFDPPHDGHMAAARAARDGLGLDRVLLVVANDPWQKSPNRRITPAADRLAMVEAACDGEAGIEASAIELERGGPSYTIETVEHLQGRADAAGLARPDLFLVIGSDLVPTLPTWHRVDDLRAAVTLAVVTRPRSPVIVPVDWQAVTVAGEEVDVSSSQLRDLLHRGLSVDGLVGPAVIRCMAGRGLYAVSR